MVWGPMVWPPGRMLAVFRNHWTSCVAQISGAENTIWSHIVYHMFVYLMLKFHHCSFKFFKLPLSIIHLHIFLPSTEVQKKHTGTAMYRPSSSDLCTGWSASCVARSQPDRPNRPPRRRGCWSPGWSSSATRCLASARNGEGKYHDFWATGKGIYRLSNKCNQPNFTNQFEHWNGPNV